MIDVLWRYDHGVHFIYPLDGRRSNRLLGGAPKRSTENSMKRRSNCPSNRIRWMLVRKTAEPLAGRILFRRPYTSPQRILVEADLGGIR